MKQNEEEMQVRVNLSQAEDVVCKACGNYTFEPVILFKKLSPIVSPTGKEALVPINTFACNACGNINDEFLPESIKRAIEEKRNNIQSSSAGMAGRLTLLED